MIKVLHTILSWFYYQSVVLMLWNSAAAFAGAHPPDTRQDLTGLFTEKPQSGEVTVGERIQVLHMPQHFTT